MSAHSVPFFCPYCGEEDIEPVGDAGGWRCGACTRGFTLRSLPAGGSAPAPADPERGRTGPTVRR